MAGFFVPGNRPTNWHGLKSNGMPIDYAAKTGLVYSNRFGHRATTWALPSLPTDQDGFERAGYRSARTRTILDIEGLNHASEHWPAR